MGPFYFDQISKRLAACRLARRRALRGRGAAAIAPLAGIVGEAEPAA